MPERGFVLKAGFASKQPRLKRLDCHRIIIADASAVYPPIYRPFAAFSAAGPSSAAVISPESRSE